MDQDTMIDQSTPTTPPPPYSQSTQTIAVVTKPAPSLLFNTDDTPMLSHKAEECIDEETNDEKLLIQTPSIQPGPFKLVKPYYSKSTEAPLSSSLGDSKNGEIEAKLESEAALSALMISTPAPKKRRLGTQSAKGVKKARLMNTKNRHLHDYGVAKSHFELASTTLEEDAALAQDLPAQPEADTQTTDRDEAFKNLLGKIPAEHLMKAKAEVRILKGFIKELGPRQVLTQPSQGAICLVKGMVHALRHHQMWGTGWMAAVEQGSRGHTVHGGIVADHMGLGKTIQQLALIVNRLPPYYQGVRCTLIVVPSGLLSQWYEETQNHCEMLKRPDHSKKEMKRGLSRVKIYDKVVAKNSSNAVADIEECDIMFATYHQVMESKRKNGTLHQAKFFRVVLDEAHAIKNIYGARAKACHALQGYHHWAMTGTPTPNGKEELRSLFMFIKHEIAHQKECFSEPGIGEKLKSAIHQHVLRRVPNDQFLGGKLIDLPQIITSDVTKLEFSPIMKLIYQKLDNGVRRRVLELKRGGNKAPKNRTMIIGLLTILRRFVTHPLLVEDSICEYYTLDELRGLEVIATEKHDLQLIKILLAAKNNPQPPVPCSRTHRSEKKAKKSKPKRFDCNDCGDKLPQQVYLADPCAHAYCSDCAKAIQDTQNNPVCGTCNKSVVQFNAYDSKHGAEDGLGEIEAQSQGKIKDWMVGEHIWRSSKLKFAEDNIRQMLDADPMIKTIVYTQWVYATHTLAQMCKENGWECRKYNGMMDQNEKNKAINDFKAKNKNVKVFIATLQTGSLGLNLTEASVVILLDPW